MSKYLTLGNGSTLIGFDADAQIKDVYFPHVGLENHVGRGCVHRVGVWADGMFHWFDDSSWNIHVGAEADSQVGKTTAENKDLGLSILITDVVYNEKNIVVRKFLIKNEQDNERVVKLFFGQEFRPYESESAHTAYFSPDEHVIIHYRGQRAFLVNAVSEGISFDEYTTGIRGIWGKEGSFKDAEEGILEKNPIEHGPADSVIGCSLRLEAKEKREVYYWMCEGKSVAEVTNLNEYVLSRSPEHLITTTRNFWKAWVNRRPFTFYGMSSAEVELFKKSLFIIRTHVDNEGGVIASADSDILHQGKDTYAYVWPRDGAIITVALYQSGSYSPAKHFFEFCNRAITPEGYFMHKYTSDGSLGSSWHPWIRNGKRTLPIQEDETAVVIFSLWRYYELSKDLEFIEDIYNTLIKKSADFLLSFRDDDTGLPLPSYDVWEERFGTHTYTAASVYGALSVASKFSQLLGKSEEAIRYENGAREVQEAIIKYCYDAGEGMFYRSVTPQGASVVTDRTYDASSVYGVFRFGVLPAHDERLRRAFTVAKKRLTVPGHVGGIKRYENDNYFKSGSDAYENPWFITTLWFAQFEIANAKQDDDFDGVRSTIAWVAKYSGDAKVLSEQINPYTGALVSVSPLVWSHAEYVNTVLNYLNKLGELNICPECDPLRNER